MYFNGNAIWSGETLYHNVSGNYLICLSYKYLKKRQVKFSQKIVEFVM